MDARQTSLLIAIAAAFILMALFFIFFIVTLLRNQKQKAKLYQASLRAEITTLENERSRVAADLHDELAPLLVGVKFNISSLELPDAENAAIVEKAQNTMDRAMTRIREIARDLLPQVLYRKGLAVAMEDFIGHVTEGSGLKVRFTMDAAEWPPERSVHIFRILQEIIHNTIKHAKASELVITVTGSPGGLLVTTRDNGVGFDYAPYDMEGSGLGLRNLGSRADILGGKMFIETAPGKGTLYEFRFPDG